jgi:hypothetical protein
MRLPLQHCVDHVAQRVIWDEFPIKRLARHWRGPCWKASTRRVPTAAGGTKVLPCTPQACDKCRVDAQAQQPCGSSYSMTLSYFLKNP